MARNWVDAPRLTAFHHNWLGHVRKPVEMNSGGLLKIAAWNRAFPDGPAPTAGSQSLSAATWRRSTIHTISTSASTANGTTITGHVPSDCEPGLVGV